MQGKRIGPKKKSADDLGRGRAEIRGGRVIYFLGSDAGSVGKSSRVLERERGGGNDTPAGGCPLTISGRKGTEKQFAGGGGAGQKIPTKRGGRNVQGRV